MNTEAECVHGGGAAGDGEEEDLDLGGEIGQLEEALKEFVVTCEVGGEGKHDAGTRAVHGPGDGEMGAGYGGAFGEKVGESVEVGRVRCGEGGLEDVGFVAGKYETEVAVHERGEGADGEWQRRGSGCERGDGE